MKFKQFSKKSVSLILAVMMLISAISIGTFTTTAADVAPAESAADYVSNATSANGTITVYFDNSNVKWNNVYVYFKSTMHKYSYENDVQDPGTAYAMSVVSGNIYSYTYTGDYGDKIAFSENNMSGWGNFNWGKASYREDFSTEYSKGNNMFTPSSTVSSTSSQSTYYDNGTWSTYGGSSSGGGEDTGWGIVGNIKNSNGVEIGWGDNKYSNSLKLTRESSSSSVYYADVIVDSTHKYFRFLDSSSLPYGQWSDTEDESIDGYTREEPYASKEDSDIGKSFKIDNYEGSVRIYFNSTYQDNGVTKPGVWYESLDKTWYLSGYLNKKDTGVKSSDYKFTRVSDGIYTLTVNSFADSENGYQYVTINDGTNVYHPANSNADSGTAADTSKTDTTASGTNINTWRVPTTAGVPVTFTWNSKTNTLTWTTDYYTVNINNGIKHFYYVSDDEKTRSSVEIASSYINTTGKPTTVLKKKTDLSVEFGTSFANSDSRIKSGSDYIYKVYGYSILMTTTTGKTVSSVIKVNTPKVGEFTATFNNIPSNITQVDITPVYVVSDAYAKSTGMDFTTVYLKYKPGDSTFFNGTYEPRYYIWRYNDAGEYTKSTNTATIKNRAGTSVALNHTPTGDWPGQKMLYVGNDTYMALLPDYLSGITFNSGDSENNKQTFDFDEFVKLQKLGYNNITFEPKKTSSDTIAKQFDTQLASSGNVLNTGTSKTMSYLTDTNINARFELLKDLEGNYLDVFENPLVDKDGNYINEDDLTSTTELNKLSEIIAKLNGSPTPLYGVRYGDGSNETSSDNGKTPSNYTAKATYGMEYPIRAYYFTRNNTTATMVAQLVSGYGTIEYNYLPDGSTTNADRYLNYSRNSANCKADDVIGIDWNYYLGVPRTSKTGQQFVDTPYSLIPATYKNVPYIVSYAPEVGVRVDGRWYYSRVAPTFNLNVKVGTGTGDSFRENPDVGTASINGQGASTTAEISTTANVRAAAKNGYKFVGYYDSSGNLLSEDINYSFLVVGDTTIYAVFEESKGTLTVRNDIFTDKRSYTIGSGITGVKIDVWHSGKSTSADPDLTDGGENKVQASVEIKEGDRYRITLYGTPLGDDTFERFLSDQYFYDEEDDYTVLADRELDYKNQTTSPYVYQFDIVKWSSADLGGAEALSLQYYTDFAQASYLATLTYVYTDRFGAEKSYVVEGIQLSDDEIKGTTSLDGKPYCPSEATVIKEAPEIDDLFKDCKWTCTGADADYETQTSAVTIRAIHTNKPVNTYVWSMNAETGVYTQTGRTDLYYNDLMTLSTPSSYYDKEIGETLRFSFWKEYDVDGDGNPVSSTGDSINIDKYVEGQGSIFSMESTISIRVTAHKMYKAWYGIDTEDKDFEVDMRDATYTREKYTDDNGNVFDFVYADFALQFTAFNHYDDEDFVKVPFRELLKRAEQNGPEGYDDYNNINIGIVAVVTDMNYDGSTGVAPQVEPVSEETLKAIIDKHDADNYDENGYATGKDGEFVTGSYNDTNYIMRNLNDIVDDLTILGRYNYYFKFDNTDYWRSKVFTVYAYISYNERSDDTNEWSERKYVFSDPEVMNIYNSAWLS